MNCSDEQVDEMKKQGSDLIDRNCLDKAKALFSEILRHRPDDAELWCRLSTIYGRLGRFEKAAECAQRAIALRPDLSNAYLNLGTVMLRTGRYVDAIEQYRKVLDIEQAHAGARFNIGQAQAALGKHDAAMENYRAAFLLSPSQHFGGILKRQGLKLVRDGRLIEAGMLFSLLCEVFPDDAEAWHVLSNINGQLGKIDAAADCCRRVLAIQPGHCDAHVNLGHVHFQQGRLDEAAALYLKALDVNPLSIAALNALAVTSTTPGHFKNYINAYLHAVDSLPDPVQARTVFISVMENNIPEQYQPWLDDELKKCFLISGADYTPIALVTACTLKYKYGITVFRNNADDAVEAAIDQIACDELFTVFLEKTINNDPELEALLTKVRRTLLLKYCRGEQLSAKEVRVTMAIFHQCLNNEYVFSIFEDERRLVIDLKKSIEERVVTDGSPTARLEIGLSVFGMYGSLKSLSCAEILAAMPRAGWSAGFQPFLVDSLLNPAEEERIMAKVESISTIHDPTSQLVQSQYEENPYPRWLAVPKAEHSNLAQLLKQEFLHFSPPQFLRQPMRILIAGCGTGWQPIQTSLRFSKNHDIEILAVDISRRSLAYAMRMARKYGVKNVRFLQGDILELAHIGEQFHIIECQGVLHHMARPVEGWRALSDLLVDNGLMSIGLYSKAGRAGLEPMREMVRREGLIPDADSIRAFRNHILAGRYGNHRIYSPDFYSTSGCRDLLFHFVEHKYTPLELDGMIRELNLNFIGFTFTDARIMSLYRGHFPQDRDMTNLVLWEQFEEMYPNTFAKMYQFWCQKA